MFESSVMAPRAAKLVATGFVCCLLCGLTPAKAGTPRRLQGHVPASLARLKPLAALNSNTNLDLVLALPWRNRLALTNLLQDLYNPASPRFHQYLTPAQFNQRFGPSPEDYRTLQAFARSNGWNIMATYADRSLLAVRAPVGAVEKALQVRLRLYPHPEEARTFFAPDTEPTVDSTVPLLYIAGLQDYQRPRPAYHFQPLAAVPQANGSGLNGAYRGLDFRAAYAPGVALTGAGQTVGLLQFDGYYSNDIVAYENQSGLPNVPLTNVLVAGFSGNPYSSNNVTEVSLDIEMAIAMAPGLSQVVVYEGSPGSTTAGLQVLQRMASDNLAKQLSCSWTWSPFDPASEQYLQQFGAQGQSFFTASGDNNAYGGSIPKPADDLYATVVGGTTLTTSGPGGAWTSETTWKWSSSVGSSGGISTSYSIPAWQQGLDMSTNLGSTAWRNIPDVALTGDQVEVIHNNGYSNVVGGTSCAAPLWAGFMALVNQQAQANGQAPVGFLNPLLYALGKSDNYGALFHDITTGNNTTASNPNRFYAVAGYDLCTGWGTPNGSNFINALLAPILLSGSRSIAAEQFPDGVIDPGENITVNLALTNAGLTATTNLVATLLATNGVLFPGPPQSFGAIAPGNTVSRPFSLTAAGVCGNAITATLLLQDNGADLGTASFKLPLGGGVFTTNFSETFDGVAAPALPAGWTTTAGGGESLWTTSTATNYSSPNAVYSSDPATSGSNALVSPVIALPPGNNLLTFQQNYVLEANPSNGRGYDGGVLEIKIGNGAFADILSAGGSFLTNGYNYTVPVSYGSPFAGRQAWSGISGGFIGTTVRLPDSAAGQDIQLRWRCATDAGNSYPSTGWYIDSVSLLQSNFVCAAFGADVALSQTASQTAVLLSNSFSLFLSITNPGPSAAWDITLADPLPPGTLVVSASAGLANVSGTLLGNLGALAGGTATNLTVTLIPTIAGVLTNTVLLSASSYDPVSANNTAATSVRVLHSPSLQTVQRTGSVVSVSVPTAPALSYSLEFKNQLSDPAWTPILPPQTGTGSPLVLQDQKASVASRFYRVRVE